MADVTDLKLEITTSPERPGPTLEAATALIQVTMEVELDPQSDSDQDGYDGQFQILSGNGPDKNVEFVMQWGGWAEFTTPAGTLELPLFFNQYALTLDNGTRQTITRQQRVLRSKLNVNPGFEIRFNESLRPGANPPPIPQPGNDYPWDFPLAPWPVREQQKEAITARAVLIRRSPHKPVTLVESNTVIRAF